jgi:hypothetical protein
MTEENHKYFVQFDRAVEELPQDMNLSDLLAFFSGVATIYKQDLSTVGAILLAFSELEENSQMTFKDKKLEELFRGGASKS